MVNKASLELKNVKFLRNKITNTAAISGHLGNNNNKQKDLKNLSLCYIIIVKCFVSLYIFFFHFITFF